MALADDIAAALVEGFDERKQAGEFDPLLDDFMANEVVPVWQGNYPTDTGEGRESIEVTQKASGGKGEVSATDEAAHIIEWGSVDTPEFAPRARTIEHFSQ